MAYAKQGYEATDSKGFSIVELLVTLLITTLASVMLATGVPVALETYKKIVDKSNAQVLLATTTTILRDEITYANDATVVGVNKITYYRGQSNEPYAIVIKDSKLIGGLVVEGSGKDDDSLFDHSENKTFEIRCDSIEQSDDKSVVLFKNLKVVKIGQDTPLANLKEFDIRIV